MLLRQKGKGSCFCTVFIRTLFCFNTSILQRRAEDFFLPGAVTFFAHENFLTTMIGIKGLWAAFQHTFS